MYVKVKITFKTQIQKAIKKHKLNKNHCSWRLTVEVADAVALWAKLLVRLALAHLTAIAQRLRRHRVLIRAQTNMADGGAVSAAWPRHTQAAAVSAVLQNYTASTF